MQNVKQWITAGANISKLDPVCITLFKQEFRENLVFFGIFRKFKIMVSIPEVTPGSQILTQLLWWSPQIQLLKISKILGSFLETFKWFRNDLENISQNYVFQRHGQSMKYQNTDQTEKSNGNNIIIQSFTVNTSDLDCTILRIL